MVFSEEFNTIFIYLNIVSTDWIFLHCIKLNKERIKMWIKLN